MKLEEIPVFSQRVGLNDVFLKFSGAQLTRGNDESAICPERIHTYHHCTLGVRSTVVLGG